MTTKVLVTGAAGFIGSNYLRHVLATTGDSIVALDALTYAGNLKSISDLVGDRVSFVQGNIADREAVAEAMDGCEQVVHLAAETHVDRSIHSPDAFIQTNCMGTNVLCDVARQQGVAKFVHVSTDEVYGSVEQGRSTENSPLAPRSAYAASKAASDLIALSYFHTHEVPVIVTRASNNYGPFQFFEKLIPLFVTRLLDGQSVPLYGDGLNRRDWMHVEDHCRAIELLRSVGVAGEVYNIAGGNEASNLWLTKCLVELCGADESQVKFVEDRLGHDRRYALDCAKLHALGWQPKKEFTQGLADTVAWYRENRDWWNP